MKLTANIQLKPDAAQAQALQDTLEKANEACSWISALAFEAQEFRQFKLHKLVYREVRERFGLSAQVTVRCIAKVADAYKVGGKDAPRKFRRHASQPFDSRIFRFVNQEEISLWTTAGRLRIPFICGEHQRRLLRSRKGEVDLIFVRGKWYIACCCEVQEQATVDTEDFLGVDLGIVTLAYDSEGEKHSGEAVDKNHRKFSHRRRNLQRKKTRAAKGKLRKISGRQARFQKDVNHCISKKIVEKAQRYGCGIALEDLQGIRTRVKARRRQRSRFSNWGFYQLRCFIEYKAQRAGIPVVFVDPKFTSQECSECGLVDRKNRTSQSSFSCVSCGFAGVADHVAARNIRARAVVNQPMVCASSGVATSRLL